MNICNLYDLYDLFITYSTNKNTHKAIDLLLFYGSISCKWIKHQRKNIIK